MREHSGSFDLLQNREMLMDNAVWERCITEEKEFLKTMRKQSSCGNLRQSMDMKEHNTTWIIMHNDSLN